MRRARPVALLLVGLGVLAATGCPGPTAPHQIAVGGGGGGAALLVFIVQPATAIEGTIIAPAIQVAVEDSAGTVDTTATGGVTVALTNPGTATLSGTTTQTLTSGIATFSDLIVNVAGSYTLTATSSGRTNGVSATFNITTATPAGRSP